MRRVLVIAGASEARELIDKLSARGGIKIWATVVTPYGAQLLEHAPVEIITGRLNTDDFSALLRELLPDFVVDASHPYAEEVSQNVLGACQQVGLAYVRLERPCSPLISPCIQTVASFEQAANFASAVTDARAGRILLTTGSKDLEVFVSHIRDYKARLVVRVLPVASVIARCEELGLGPDNIVAARGPFSAGFNVALIKHYDVRVMVSKESGREGGLEDKINACEQTGISLVTVVRPRIEYPVQFANIGDVVSYMEARWINL